MLTKTQKKFRKEMRKINKRQKNVEQPISYIYKDENFLFTGVDKRKTGIKDIITIFIFITVLWLMLK